MWKPKYIKMCAFRDLWISLEWNDEELLVVRSDDIEDDSYMSIFELNLDVSSM